MPPAELEGKKFYERIIFKFRIANSKGLSFLLIIPSPEFEKLLTRNLFNLK